MTPIAADAVLAHDAAQAAGAGAGDWADLAEARVLDTAVRLAGEGLAWNAALVRRASSMAGLSTADAALLLPNGALDLAVLLWRRHDVQALAGLARIDPASLKVRERIRCAVMARVEAAVGDEAAVRAASLYLARPGHGAAALRLGWASADALWRWAGDTATDQNHYTKRAILEVILATTTAVWLARGRSDAERHLDARIDGVMAFERWKATLPPADGALSMVAGVLGRMRYAGR